MGFFEAVAPAGAGSDYVFSPRRDSRCRIRARAGSPGAFAGPRGSSTAARREPGSSLHRRCGTLVIYELHVGHVHGAGNVCGRDPRPARAGGARRQRDRADARGGVSRRPRLGIRRRVHLGRATAYGGPPGSQRLWPARTAGPGGDPRRRLQPHRRLWNAGARGVRPVLHERTRLLGQGDQLRRHRLRSRPRMGARRARPAGSATTGSTAFGSTRSMRSSTRAPSTSWPRWPARPRDATGGPGDRRERPQRSSRDAGTRRRRLGAATRSGPTISTTRCDARHRRARRVLPDFGRSAARQGVAPAVRPRRHLLAVSPPPVRRAGRRSCRRERFVVFSQDHDQVGNRAFGDRLPAAAARWPRSARSSRPSRRCCSWARSTASRRRSSSSPTTSTRTSRRPRATGGARSSPRSRQFSKEEIPDPQDRATFERSKLTRRRDRHSRVCIPNCSRPVAGWRRGTSTRSSSTRTRGGCESGAGRLRAGHELRVGAATGAVLGRDAVVLATAAAPSALGEGPSSSRRCRER